MNKVKANKEIYFDYETLDNNFTNYDYFNDDYFNDNDNIQDDNKIVYTDLKQYKKAIDKQNGNSYIVIPASAEYNTAIKIIGM